MSDRGGRDDSGARDALAGFRLPGVTADDYFRMLEAHCDGQFYWDPGADLVRWSPRLLDALGYAPRDEFHLEDVIALVHPEDREHFRAILRDAIAHGAPYTGEYRLIAADGGARLYRGHGFWLKDGGPGPARLIGFITEIREIADLRAEVGRREALFRAFFDNAPAAVYIKDAERNFLYGNAMAAKIAGTDVETFLRSRTDDLFDAETLEELIACDREILEHGRTISRHGFFTASTGERHYVFDTAFRLSDPATGAPLVGGVTLDTTRQHEMEQALARTLRLEALGTLVGGIAHDFNNTLAVLQGNLDLLDAETDPEEQALCLSELRAAVGRASRLTEQLLAYGRRSILHPGVHNLNTVVAECDRMLRRMLPATVEIEPVLGGGLWNAEVDRAQVENALLNLAVNAHHAMPKGGKLTLETANVRIDPDYLEERAEQIPPGRYVLLAVTDTGIGMTPEQAARAFEPFYTTKPVGEGSGMGLAMVHGLMGQIGGTARIYSEPGVGTTVKLYFPASREPVTAKRSADTGGLSGSEHILLVEDDAAVRRVLRRQLRTFGYRVTEAESGDAAWALLQGVPDIDLMMTDIVMPGTLQGPALAKKARELRPDLPVVFMSGYPREAAIHGNGLHPDDENLVKPVPTVELGRALRRRLSRRG